MVPDHQAIHRVDDYAGASTRHKTTYYIHADLFQRHLTHLTLGLITSLNIQGVGYKELTTPADFVPFAHIFLPRKTIGPISGIVDQFKGIVQVGTLLLSSGV